MSQTEIDQPENFLTKAKSAGLEFLRLELNAVRVADESGRPNDADHHAARAQAIGQAFIFTGLVPPKEIDQLLSTLKGGGVGTG